jgi:glycosyltransferase involved in cell wall biosynthesis
VQRTRLRRRRSLVAAAVARSRGEAPRRPPAVTRRPLPPAAKRVLFVSHTDFTGNSALHAFRLAEQLHAHGYDPAVAVPADPGTVADVGLPPFPVVAYHDVDDRYDFVHAFTPRERVRKLTGRLGLPYVVHLEDDDAAVLASELGAAPGHLQRLPEPVLDRVVGDGDTHPLRGPAFVAGAAGVSLVVDRLRELVPAGVPVEVVQPGYDDDLLQPTRVRDAVRAELRLSPGDCVVLYTGTIHAANADDVRRLYDAVLLLRRGGSPVVLVKTGWNAPDAPSLRTVDGALRDLGRVPRPRLAELLAAADVLVQPGHPGRFDDFRFPAKLPDFLASGKPVVLPRANVGLVLRDREEALVLQDGTVEEIAAAIAELRSDAGLAERVGAGGRAFAFRELRWSASADRLEALYASGGV